MKLTTSPIANALLICLATITFSPHPVISSARDERYHRRQISQDVSESTPSSSSVAVDNPGGFSSFSPPFNNSTASSTTLNPSASSDDEPTSTITKVPLTTQVTITHLVTDAFGQESTSLAVVPTTTMVASDDPSLANGGVTGSNSGVTPEQKKIIIGVVVSIVGVLSLAGIAGLVWRIWFRGHDNENSNTGGKISPSFSRSSVQQTGSFLQTTSGGEHRKAASLNPSSNF